MPTAICLSPICKKRERKAAAAATELAKRKARIKKLERYFTKLSEEKSEDTLPTWVTEIPPIRLE